MRFEMLVGLNLSNESLYTAYREAMAPLLTAHEGGFGCDFKVSEVLKAPADTGDATSINRVFTIYFASEQQKDAFFNHEAYQAIKAEYFEKSVNSTTIIASYFNTN
ncbi:DUF1330 domain-containing protein [Thalassotalea marina]|uniref:DUF1330 domain-containing protein n=1 Tax=Thalassotalea marina TaxID=1673741 RepID=A0A919BKX1_9GAMM|nr:DUF1330 domain-containing protein [Thalassotalea marina]GHF96097.1 hypothetical protein GCM10017161_25550 [Thalassotalea marina]